MALPALTFLSACNDSVEYDAPKSLDGYQVYFPSEQQNLLELSSKETSVTVQINRVKTEGSLTVPLQSAQKKGSSTMLNIPESVTFADGEAKAFIEITYDPTQMEYSDTTKVSISIGQDNYTTPYGYATWEMRAFLAEPWGEWYRLKADYKGKHEWPLSAEDSTGVYYYDIGWLKDSNGDAIAPDPDLPIYFRENEADPARCQFRIAHWFADHDLLLNASYNEQLGIYTFTIPVQPTGFVLDNYGEFYVTDFVNYWVNVAHEADSEELNYDLQTGYPGIYDPKTGLFELVIAYYIDEEHCTGAAERIGCYGQGYEYFQLDGFYKPDYALDVNYKGILKDVDDKWFALIELSLGADVDKAKYALTSASDVALDIAKDIDENRIKGATIRESNEIRIPLEKDGKYRVTGLSYSLDEEGNSQSEYYASCSFELCTDGTVWNSIGYGGLVDEIMTPYLHDIWKDYCPEEPAAFEVEILESSKKPGLYRLVYPYGKAFLYNVSGDYDTRKTYYWEIDASDPNGVFFETQENGLNWGYGNTYMQFYAYTMMQKDPVKYSIEKLKKAGYMGKVKNDIITFPKGLISVRMPGRDKEWVKTNPNGLTEIYLPKAFENLSRSEKAWNVNAQSHEPYASVKNFKVSTRHIHGPQSRAHNISRLRTNK